MKATTATTIISALVLLSSASSAAAADQSKRFNLVAVAKQAGYQPDVVFKGPWLSSFHVGAGQSTIVTVADKADAVPWYIQDEVLVEDASYPFVVGLEPQEPYMSDAPEGYNYVSLNIGDPATSGQTPWTYDEETKQVYLTTADGTFSICNVNGTSPYFGLGPQSQLLWRSLSTSVSDPRQPPKCADVSFYAVDIEEY